MAQFYEIVKIVVWATMCGLMGGATFFLLATTLKSHRNYFRNKHPRMFIGKPYIEPMVFGNLTFVDPPSKEFLFCNYMLTLWVGVSAVFCYLSPFSFEAWFSFIFVGIGFAGTAIFPLHLRRYYY